MKSLDEYFDDVSTFVQNSQFLLEKNVGRLLDWDFPDESLSDDDFSKVYSERLKIVKRDSSKLKSEFSSGKYFESLDSVIENIKKDFLSLQLGSSRGNSFEEVVHIVYYNDSTRETYIMGNLYTSLSKGGLDVKSLVKDIISSLGYKNSVEMKNPVTAILKL